MVLDIGICLWEPSLTGARQAPPIHPEGMEHMSSTTYAVSKRYGGKVTTSPATSSRAVAEELARRIGGRVVIVRGVTR